MTIKPEIYAFNLYQTENNDRFPRNCGSTSTIGEERQQTRDKTFPEKVEDMISIASQEMVELACTERPTCMHTHCNLTDLLL